MGKPTFPPSYETLLKYLTVNDGTCPICGSSNITGQSWDYEAGTVCQEVSCDECDWSWLDSYTLTSISQITDPEDEKGKCIIPGLFLEFVYHADIIAALLKRKEILPLLIGIHEELDKVIEQVLKDK